MSKYSIAVGSRASIASMLTKAASDPTSLSVHESANGSSQRSAMLAPGSSGMAWSGR